MTPSLAAVSASHIAARAAATRTRRRKPRRGTSSRIAPDRSPLLRRRKSPRRGRRCNLGRHRARRSFRKMPRRLPLPRLLLLHMPGSPFGRCPQLTPLPDLRPLPHVRSLIDLRTWRRRSCMLLLPQRSRGRRPHHSRRVRRKLPPLPGPAIAIAFSVPPPIATFFVSLPHLRRACRSLLDSRIARTCSPIRSRGRRSDLPPLLTIPAEMIPLPVAIYLRP